MKFDPDRPVKTASGGERRRAALAKLMAEDPELMLLDEPTNHLDIEAISWLETTLRESRNSFVVISHDRAFLTALTRATLWIDRGAVRRLEQGFGSFEAWRDKTWEEEDQQRHKLNRKIKAEARWAVEGISARRKRNQGRVRALGELRAEQVATIHLQTTACSGVPYGNRTASEAREEDNLGLARRALTIFSSLVRKDDDEKLVPHVVTNGGGQTT